MGIVLKRQESGQMTVELAVAFPVLMIVALIATNALLFFSECAAFDNAFRDAVRIHACSPAYGQDIEHSTAQVTSALTASFDRPFESVAVAVEGGGLGHVRFTGTLEFSPTLFGLGLRSSVFGIALPSIRHATSFTVDRYKPGVFV